jgi:hypothetical protein
MTTWEERMSLKAHRGEVAANERRQRWTALMESARGATEPWMHGWARIGLTHVLVGTRVHCVGCGKFYETTSIAIDPDWTAPSQEPDWPFSEQHCPAHQLVDFAEP